MTNRIATILFVTLLFSAFVVPTAVAGSQPSDAADTFLGAVSFSLRPDLVDRGQGQANTVPLLFCRNLSGEFPFAEPASTAGPKPTKHIGRSWLELGGFMTYSGISYWIKYTKKGFIEDWQFRLNWHDQSRRFFTLMAWRFDSNNFALNWSHSLAGALYYNFSRTNNLSWLQSWLMSVAGSSFWEYVVEWKEVVSINDQIMTGLGGFATAEPWYQIANYLSHQTNILLQGLSFLNPMLKLNRWFDRHDPATPSYQQPGWHDFGLFVGARGLSAAGAATEHDLFFGFHTRLLGLPEYGKPGEIQERVKDTYFSDISLDYATRDSRAEETNLTLSAVTWGWFWQRIDPGLNGYSLTVGLGSSLEYFKKRPTFSYDYAPVPVNQGIDLHLEIPRDFKDKLSILHIAGPVLDWTIFRRGLRLRTVASAYFDFALVNSLALNTYSALHNIEGMKTTVLYYGYYYGFGGTFQGSSTLEWGNFRARGLASFGAWGSADFRDRFQAQVTNNAHLDDNRTRWLLGAGWKVPRLPLEAFINLEDIYRWGRLQEVRVTGLEKRVFAGLQFNF